MPKTKGRLGVSIFTRLRRGLDLPVLKEIVEKIDYPEMALFHDAERHRR